mmetsp:Transcript_34344/g.105533  ORF Transcript_34344/g.105533 Transcript_34344/m.105533 type:complete len:230 (+) Transcript_34344:208-897(+)
MRIGSVHCSQTRFSSFFKIPKSALDRIRSKKLSTTVPFKSSGPAGVRWPGERSASHARSTVSITDREPTRAYASSKWSRKMVSGLNGPGARQKRMVWSTVNRASRAWSTPQSSTSSRRCSVIWLIVARGSRRAAPSPLERATRCDAVVGRVEPRRGAASTERRVDALPRRRLATSARRGSSGGCAGPSRLQSTADFAARALSRREKTCGTAPATARKAERGSPPKSCAN